MHLLASGESLKAREIIERVEQVADRFQIASDEMDDVRRNFVNYADRAKKSGVIASSGPWGGYRLVAPEAKAEGGAAPVSSQPSSIRPPPDASEPTARSRRQHWESLVHLPITVSLSSEFASRVISLPTFVDRVRWGNPDMLMIRPSPIARLREFDPDLNHELFSSIDVTPDSILASVEVKCGLDRDRARLFTSIAEAAANSRWANEAWLVFVDWESTDAALDDDVVSLARSVEVGLIEIQFTDEPSTLRTIVHHAAPTHPTLRVGELTQDRIGVLLAAQGLLRHWTSEIEERTFMDVEGAPQKARELLCQALDNLRTQKGFTTEGPLAETLQPLAQNNESKEFVKRVLQSSLRSAAIAGGIDGDGNLAECIGRAADESMVKVKADALRRDLGVFGETRLQAYPRST